AGPAGTMTFARFMQLALYDPSLGYYRQPRLRVGRAPGTDFFTASSSPLFGELVAAACASLLATHHAHPHDFTFVEIGAESESGILANTPHPFGATKGFRLGDPLELKGRCVVFSNELFDAQPFHRFVFRRGAWRELGVALRDDVFIEVELPEATSAPLPVTAPEGYRIDAPVEAAALAGQIAAQPWSGLFLAFDYGKTWSELAEATPAGTARAYFRHAQSNDLLARPGEQDLTCHVCWDWLADALACHGFSAPPVESQESFFVHHAADFLAQATAAEAGRFSEKKLSLLQLLHPSHLGQKFQALHAWKT
ncbi:MAG TPA: SAM-dependent methyltransferase, partial [Opitutaceae bacterium]|nr:SAM-dependent methyltransferase [Opitutaceae bacterium]